MKTYKQFILESVSIRLTKDSASIQEVRFEYESGEVYALTISNSHIEGNDPAKRYYYAWVQSRYRDDTVPDELFTDITNAIVEHYRKYGAYGYAMDMKFRTFDTKSIATKLKRQLKFQRMDYSQSNDRWIISKE